MSSIKINCDFREIPSGIPQLLFNKNVDVSFSQLNAGDYFINDEIIVERKTAADFIQSIIHNRIFEQCSKLKKESKRILIVIEGNPYITKYKIDEQAIRGAIVSILTAWQIPIICTKNPEGTADLLKRLGLQSIKNSAYIQSPYGTKPKKIKSQKLFLLQGIPSIGPALAIRLFEHFGNIKSIVNASEAELRTIKGFGKKSAKRICDFFSL